MITQVVAGFPVESEIIPAVMAPIIPPTSKMVDKSALRSAPSVATNKIMINILKKIYFI